MGDMRKISKSSKLNYVLIISFGVVLSLGVTLSMFDFIPISAHGTWQNIVQESVQVDKTKPSTTTLSLKAEDPIPHVERIILGGFGWIYEDGNSALVVTSHYGIRDSTQNPDHWHVHNVTFESVDGGSITHCITSLTNDDTAGIPINGDDIRVVIQNSKLGVLKDPPIAISFDIMPDPLKISCESGLGIGIHTTEPKPAVEAAPKKGGSPNK